MALMILLGALSVALASIGGWPVTALMLRASKSPTRVRSADERGIPLLEAPSGEPRAGAELLRGGFWIGLLERAAVAGCVLAGRPELLALVIALKGLGRYPELKAHEGAAERFLVGTFASILWAVLAGLLGWAAIAFLA